MRLIILFFLLGLLAFSFGHSKDNDLINVDYIKIQSIKSDKKYYGIIKAQNSAILSFQTEGRISYLPYTKGDFIKKGQVISRLDGELYSIKKNEEMSKLDRFLVEQKRQKSYYKRLDILHSEGAVSDNDWENAFYELKTLDKDIQTQKEKIKYIEKEISYSILTAPYDGYISEKLADVDSYVKVGAPVINFISSKGVQVEIMVDENEINKLHLNDSAKVEVLNKIYQANISHISKSSLNSGGYLIKISIGVTDDFLKEGMSADVILSSLDNENIILPISCIFEENKQKFVYKIVNIKNNIGEIKKEKVTTGQIVNNKIQVLDGIKQDDIVIIGNCVQNLKNKKVKL